MKKILEEIEQRIAKAERIIVKPPHDELDRVANDTAEEFIEAYKECQELIRKHMNDGWIPVEERLPEEAGTYIINALTVERSIVAIAKWQNKYKRFDMTGSRTDWKSSDWYPLPESYRSERRE